MSKAILQTSSYVEAAKQLRRNPEQWAAYESKGHCVVLAGPGSGKTKVLTLKLARMLAEDVEPPRGIACLTYNNECVRELSRRLVTLDVRHNRRLFVGTVHSFCLKAIVLPYSGLAGMTLPDPLRIATPTDAERIFTEALGRVVSADERPDEWRRRCDRCRRTLIDRESSDWRGQEPEAANVIEEYERLLRQNGFIDFDDMILLGLRLVESHAWIRKVVTARFPILAVDEYQDLGLALHRLVLSLCFARNKGCRLFAVGDPDQSIYSFTGARPELLTEMADDERVEKVQLRLNYRSKASIVSASEVALGETRGYKAVAGDGGVIDFHKCKDGLAEQAKLVSEKLIPGVLTAGSARNYGEIALLYRDRSQGDVIAEAVEAARMTFVRTDGNAPYRPSPFTRWLESCAAWCIGGWKHGDPALSDLLAVWRSFNGTTRSDTEGLLLAKKLVRFLFAHRGSNQRLDDWLKDFHGSCLQGAFDREPLLSEDALRVTNLLGLCAPGKKLASWSVTQFGGQGGAPDHLNLMTLHSAKGLEFDVVFMLALEQGVIPYYGENTIVLKREPRRLFYVGLTRARFEVHMLYSGWYQWKHRVFRNGPSEFLMDVQKAISAE